MAMYNPSDVNLQAFGVAGASGSIDLRPLMQQITIYENILSPIVVLEATLIDSQELSALLPLIGEESMYIQFQTPSLNSCVYNLFVTALVLNSPSVAQKVKYYTIRAVSPTALPNATTIIQKAYNTNISNIVQDIYSNYLNGNLPLQTEQTQGVQKLIINNKRPFEAIKYVLTRASSESHQSSTYVFFANQYAQYFVTIEGMFDNGVVANFTNNTVINDSIFNVIFRNVIDFTIDQQFDSISRVSQGAYATQVKTFDFLNFNFTNNPVSAAGGMSTGGGGQLNTPNFAGAAGGAGKTVYVPQNSNIPPTFISQFLPNQRSYAANIGNSVLKIRVYGDSTLAAGQQIFVNLVEDVGTTGMSQSSTLVSQNYVISKLTHRIMAASVHPRYTQDIECVSASYGQTPPASS